MERFALEALAAGREVRLVEGETPSAIRLRLIEAGARPLALEITRPTPIAAPFPAAIPRAIGHETGYLWHFTRTSPGPWPGESEETYLDALIGNSPGAAHAAEDTLARILGEGRIRASGRLIRGARPVVCLTEATPLEIMALRHYRPALLRWDFEPAAVGLPRAAAERLGLRPVRHLPPGAERTLPDEERHLFQKHDPPEVDFRREKEWRSAGDIDLSPFAPDEMRIFPEE